MEVIAVSHACPKEYDIGGVKLSTSIVHEPLTSSADYIDIDQTGVVQNRTAVHSGPVYVFFAENYDYWCSELGIDRASWGWCHWGENITLRYAGKPRLETEIHLGEIWSLGASVRLEVCGSRIPCRKVSWRCGQKDQWLQPLAESGRVGLYLRVIQGGRVHPGDKASLVSASEDAVDVATITRCAFDSSLKTTHTLDLLANHATLLGMNKQFINAKKVSIEDKLAEGKYAWKGWRSLRVFKRVDEGGGVVSFFLRSAPAQDERPLAYYRPGQFLSIKLPSGQVRSWTISDFTSRNVPKYYRISVKGAAGASAWMREHCTEGTELLARSPAGRFVLDWSPPFALRQVYLSAGIGITPVVAMLKAHARHPKFARSPAVWIHVARDGQSLPFQDEVQMPEGVALERHVFLTGAPTAATDGSGAVAQKYRPGVRYHEGRPDGKALKSILGAPYSVRPFGAGTLSLEGKMSTFYVCGPPAFEATTVDCLTGLGAPAAAVHKESFSAAGATLAETRRARVRFTRSQKEAVWERDAPVSLLELAEKVGLAPDYGCRVGACGSCAAKLTCGTVAGGVQADGSVLTCSATPASEYVELAL